MKKLLKIIILVIILILIINYYVIISTKKDIYTIDNILTGLKNNSKIINEIEGNIGSLKSQSEKALYCMSPTTWHSGKGK